MNAADTAGRKDFDPRTMSNPDRRSDCRCAVRALCGGNGNVSCADLSDASAVGEHIDLIIAEPDPRLAIDDRDRRRCCTGFTNDFLQAMRGLQVLRTWQTVCDHSGFKRDNRTMLAQRIVNFRSDVKKLVHWQSPPSSE